MQFEERGSCRGGMVGKRMEWSGGRAYNLELDRLLLEDDSSDLEVDSDGGNVGFGVRVVGETEEQARFAHARVSDQQQLVTQRRQHRHSAAEQFPPQPSRDAYFKQEIVFWV